MGVFSGPLGGLVLKSVIEGTKEINWLNAVLYLVAGYACSWLVTFVVNLLRSPYLLLREQQVSMQDAKNKADANTQVIMHRAKEQARLKAADAQLYFLGRVLSLT